MRLNAIGAAAACVLSLCMSTNIAGIDRAKLVQRLYDHAKVQGLGSLGSNCGVSMRYEEAKDLVGKYIDYHNGRVMKISVPAEEEGDEIDTWLYNRDNGKLAAEKVVEELRKEAGEHKRGVK